MNEAPKSSAYDSYVGFATLAIVISFAIVFSIFVGSGGSFLGHLLMLFAGVIIAYLIIGFAVIIINVWLLRRFSNKIWKDRVTYSTAALFTLFLEVGIVQNFYHPSASTNNSSAQVAEEVPTNSASVAPQDTPITANSADDGSTSSESTAMPDAKRVPATTARITALLAEGNALYDRAERLANETPTSSMGAATLLSGESEPAGSFYVDDRKYQYELTIPMLRGDGYGAALTLVTSESFLYSAVAAVESCDEHEARANLRVARAILNQTAKELHGTARDDWEPPQIEEGAGVQCPQ